MVCGSDHSDFLTLIQCFVWSNVMSHFWPPVVSYYSDTFPLFFYNMIHFAWLNDEQYDHTYKYFPLKKPAPWLTLLFKQPKVCSTSSSSSHTLLRFKPIQSYSLKMQLSRHVETIRGTWTRKEIYNSENLLRYNTRKVYFIKNINSAFDHPLSDSGIWFDMSDTPVAVLFAVDVDLKNTTSFMPAHD